MAKKVATEEDLAGLLAESLNKKSKDQKVAFFLDDDATPTNVAGWVGSGSDMLDIAISNRPNGGFPMGRIIEVTGLEQSGKSLMAAHSLANTQKIGGVAVLIDTETAVSREFLEAIGVDVSKLVYISADSVEQIFEYTETIIEKVRATSTNNDKPVTIVIDSMAAASTEKELDADYGKDGYATDKAIIISKAMRKITNTIGREKITLIITNQLRQKLNAMAFSDPWCVDPITTKIKIRYDENSQFYKEFHNKLHNIKTNKV
jgi:recombination protein RecA